MFDVALQKEVPNPKAVPIWHEFREMLAHMQRSTWIARLAAAFWLCAVLIVWLALSPADTTLELNDKFAHLFAFATLTILATTAFPHARSAAIFGGLCSFGGGIEFAQMIPQLHRDAELGDWVADAVAVAGVLVILHLTGLRAWWARASQSPSSFEVV